MRVRRTRATAAILLAAVVGVLAGIVTGLAVDNDGNAAAASPRAENVASRSPEEIYRNNAPGVVVVTDNQDEVVPPTLFTPGGKQEVRALGSGFVIDTRGDIVTNDHVVQGATDIRVSFGGSAPYPAKIVGTDPSSDLAVLRVAAPRSALHPLRFGDSTGVEVGDSVFAIGNPFGLERTMTAGIISALGRDIKAPDGLTIPNAIQTDAPINHGNSGGPLLDHSGFVIGVNSQIEGGTVDANVGIGFAIPSSLAQTIVDQIISAP
jgi:S1-C subfamily serine protease